MSGTKNRLKSVEFPSGFSLGLSVEEKPGKRNPKFTEVRPAHHVLPAELKRLKPQLEKALGCKVVLKKLGSGKHCLRIEGAHGDTFREWRKSQKASC